MSLHEFSLIDRFFAPLMGGDRIWLLDDGAVLPSSLTPGLTSGLTPDLTTGPDQQTVIATDTLIAGVHFRGRDPADRIAKKALRTNLSDLAAMGATPFGYLLNLSLPADITESWLASFSSGLAQDQKRFKVKLLGGDTTKVNGPLVITITVLGTVPAKMALARRKAQPGDRLYVSSTLGDSAVGLQVLEENFKAVPQDLKSHFIDRYQLPQPRLSLGQKLRGCAHAAIDISDGFLADLEHICKASDLSAWVQLSALPVSSFLQELLDCGNDQRKNQLLNLILNGGDDYELIFTAPPSESDHIAFLSQSLNLPITLVGHLGGYDSDEDKNRIHLLNEHNQSIGLHFKGYEHTW
ncbi:MAG: thiamine-phosphate kinase [Pseudomonadota bacterium]